MTEDIYFFNLHLLVIVLNGNFQVFVVMLKS